jgi:hypothetical protein
LPKPSTTTQKTVRAMPNSSLVVCWSISCSPRVMRF